MPQKSHLKSIVLLLTLMFAGLIASFYIFSFKPNQNLTGLGSANAEFSTSSQIFHLKVAETDFWVPGYYLIQRPSEMNVDLISFHAKMPNFAPKLEERNDLKVAQKNLKQHIRISLHDKRETRLQKPSALETYQTVQDQIYGKPFVKSGEQYELTVYETSRPKVRAYEEMYEERRDGKLASFIVCTVAALNDGCTSYQENEKFIIEIFFNKIYLPEWKSIQQKAGKLIQSFQQAPAKPQPLKKAP